MSDTMDQEPTQDGEAEELSFRDRAINTHKQTLTNLDTFIKMMSQGLGKNFSMVVSAMKTVINNQGMELIILREIENGIRKQNMSPELMQERLEELSDIRQKMLENAKAATAAAATPKKE